MGCRQVGPVARLLLDQRHCPAVAAGDRLSTAWLTCAMRRSSSARMPAWTPSRASTAAALLETVTGGRSSPTRLLGRRPFGPTLARFGSGESASSLPPSQDGKKSNNFKYCRMLKADGADGGNRTARDKPLMLLRFAALLLFLCVALPHPTCLTFPPSREVSLNPGRVVGHMTAVSLSSPGRGTGAMVQE